MLVGITGSTGFIGQVLLRSLRLPDSARLRCLVRGGSPSMALPRVEWMSGDLTNEADCEEFVEGLDAVVHLAQSNSPASSDRHWPSDFAANIAPSLNLLEAIRRRRGRRPCHIVFASSGGAVYGRMGSGQDLFRETDECLPLSPYGIQKLAVEHYLRTACDQGWLCATVLRIGNAYGRLLAADRRQGLIGVAMARIMSGQPVNLFGSADTIRDYIHVADVAEAFSAALLIFPPNATQPSFRVFNIASGVGYSVTEVLALIAEVTGRRIQTLNCDFGAAAISSVPANVLSITKASEGLNWVPRIKMRDGIANMLAE